jgi:hypothetical protein
MAIATQRHSVGDNSSNFFSAASYTLTWSIGNSALNVSVDRAIEIQTATMDIADYLKQGGQTAGHRELWRLLRTLFKETSDRRVD